VPKHKALANFNLLHRVSLKVILVPKLSVASNQEENKSKPITLPKKERIAEKHRKIIISTIKSPL